MKFSLVWMALLLIIGTSEHWFCWLLIKRRRSYLYNGNPYPGKMTSLSHWGRVTHICVSKLSIIGSDNGLSPNRRQAIIWTNDGILLIRPIGTNFNEILIEINIISFKEIHLKMSSGKWRPFCLGLNPPLGTGQPSLVPDHHITHWGQVTKLWFSEPNHHRFR